MKSIRNPIFLLLLGAVLLFSCEKEDDQPAPGYEVPETYNFENVNYSGQLQRLSMLQEIRDYMRAANTPGTALDAARLKAMYANDAAAAGWKQTYEASRQLRDKTLESQRALFEDLIGRLAAASASTVPGSEGQAGVVASLDGEKQYLLGPTGVEYNQLIEKGIMGATFYYQATAVYLSADKMNVDNATVTPGEGTAMEHHWDEAFGYLGVPRDFPLSTDGAVFWGSYSLRRDPLLNTSPRIMEAFRRGRAAISNDDLNGRDQALEEVRAVWEEIVASTALSYLNQAISQFDDFALRAHALSEGAGFIYSLQFNPDKRLTNQETGELLTLLGGTDNPAELNFYQTAKADLTQARDRLADAYDLEGMKEQF